MHECMGTMFYFPLWCFGVRQCAGSRGTLPFFDCWSPLPPHHFPLPVISSHLVDPQFNRFLSYSISVFEFTVGFLESEGVSVQEERFIGEGTVETSNDKDLTLQVLYFAHATSLSRSKKLTSLDNETLPFLGEVEHHI